MQVMIVAYTPHGKHIFHCIYSS